MTSLETRRMTAGEFAAYRKRLIPGYAAERARADGLSLEQATENARAQTDQLLPDGPDTPGMLLLVGEDSDGGRVGHVWIALRPDGQDAWIYDIEVDADRRGEGFGRALLTAGESAARTHGATHIGLNVFGRNTTARRLYESSGYETIALQMRKPLQPS
jgi:ribosomal protein S18 acetylase RimI-like enzyme